MSDHKPGPALREFREHPPGQAGAYVAHLAAAAIDEETDRADKAEAEVERLRERLEKTIIKSWRWEYAATHDLIDGEVWARPKSVLKRILATYNEEKA